MSYRGCRCAGFGNGPTDPPYGPPPSGATFTCKDGSTTPNPTTCPEWGQTDPGASGSGTMAAFESECWAPHKSTLLGIYALCALAGAAAMHVVMKKGWH